MLRISAAVQNYDWGSATAIPEFLGEVPTGEPVAELWFGTHPLGTSVARSADGSRALSDVVSDLSFMLKVLAPAKPLSIQVHPSSALAKVGFAAEEAAGIDLTDPSRDYKDASHKPEMVYALTPFETLVGLRSVDEASALLKQLDVPLAWSLLSHAGDGVEAVVEHLLSSAPDPESVDAFVGACEAQLDAGADIGRGYFTVVDAARVHPSDPGLVVALLMNRLTLAPGEAAFLDSGLIHAHLSGLCLEVMAASDNVFRAGLTTKRVNPRGVADSLDAAASSDPIVRPVQFGDDTQIHVPSAGMFALSVTRGPEPLLPGGGDRVVLCLDGEVELSSAGGERVSLSRGQAAFATADDGAIAVTGTGTTAQAYVP